MGQPGIRRTLKTGNCDDNGTLYPIPPRVFMQVYVINPTLKTITAIDIAGSLDDVRGLIGFASIDSDEIDNNGDRLFFDEECFIRQQDGVGRFKVDNLAPVAGIGVIANSRDEAKSIHAPEVSLQDLTKRITFL